MTALAFDTLAYVKRLKAAGVPEAQAEVQAEVLLKSLKISLPPNFLMASTLAEAPS